ncbi:3-dehydroquinate dehydratase [Spirochaetia bacterium]|nr:3-dehydroquinate dehydratase [Spirochaetia bacterium]
MAKICLCLTAKTIERNVEILNKYRKYTDMAELRVDCLDPDDRLRIRRFPELAGLPVILTIRRDIDGGYFTGGEAARVNILARGLAYAEADRRLNFAYVDIEEDLNVPSLEEAARTFGTRIIRSYHNLQGVDDDIPGKIQSMRHVGDELIKVAVTARSTSDVLRVLRASKLCANQEKILLCMGHLGSFSRILAEQFGSFLSYAGALSESGTLPAAPGQIDVKTLAELYRFRKISNKTKIYGVVGYPLKATSSPPFFNTIFGVENTDAVYVPFPADSISDFIRLADELDVQGLSVTVPYKEAVLTWLSEESQAVQSIGACNTMIRFARGWLGANTDGPGFSDSLLEFLGTKNLRWKRVTIIGAGGVARAVVSEVHRLGGKALILNRTVHKARDIALPYKFAWGNLDNQGIEMMDKYQDIIIQTTSVGMTGSDALDPLEMYTFTGREAVMDLVYKPEITPFLRRAAVAGCRTINGYDMLIRQARYQYTQFMGREYPAQLLSRVQMNRS